MNMKNHGSDDITYVVKFVRAETKKYKNAACLAFIITNVVSARGRTITRKEQQHDFKMKITCCHGSALTGICTIPSPTKVNDYYPKRAALGLSDHGHNLFYMTL